MNEKHDGWLDSTQRVRVYHREAFRDVLLESAYHSIYLEPPEALSLLVWLTQEKAKLERMAKEISPA